MIKQAKRLVAVFIAAGMCLCSVSVSAANDSALTYEDAAYEFYETLELIDAVYYYSDEINYRELLDAALKSVFDQMDPYSDYMTQEEYDSFSSYAEPNKSGIGVSIRVESDGRGRIMKIFKGSPAEAAGLRVNDVIVDVGGIDISGRDLTDIRNLIIGDIGTTVNIKIVRDGATKTIAVTRGIYEVPLAEHIDISELLPGASNSKTAYVQISSFANNADDPKKDTAKQFKAIYNRLKALGVENLIIDLRDNGGGDVAALVEIGEVVVKSGTMFTLYFNDGESEVHRSTAAEPGFNIAVLVNQNTASSAEILASAIKESGSGIIVGSETFGKGVGQITIPSADESHMIKLTITEIKSRNGNKINGVGVIPDIYVEAVPWLIEDAAINQNSAPEEIVMFRKALNYLGYSVKTDSQQFDSELTSVVKRCQTDMKMAADGVCSPEFQIKVNDRMQDKYYELDVALKKAYDALNK